MSLEDPYNDVRGTNHTQVDPSDTLSWTNWCIDSRMSHNPVVHHNDGLRASSQDFFLDDIESKQLNTVVVKEEEGRSSSSPDSAGKKSAGTRGTDKISSSRSVASLPEPIPSSTSIGNHKPEENAYISSKRRGYAPKQEETSWTARTKETSDEEELRARAQRYYAEISVNKNIPTSELKASWPRGLHSRKRSHAATRYGPTERGGEGTSESIEEALATHASINQRIDDIYGQGAHRKKKFRDGFMQAQSLAPEGSQNRGEMRADEPASLASRIAQGQMASSPMRGLSMNGLDFTKTEDVSQIRQSSGALNNNLAMAKHGNGDIFSGLNTAQHRNLADMVDTESEQTQVLRDIAQSNTRPSTNQPILEGPSEPFDASAECDITQPEHHTVEQQSGSDPLEEQNRHDEVISNQLSEFNRNLNAVMDLRGHMTSTLQNFATKIGKLETEAVTQAQQYRALQAASAKQAVKIRVIEDKCTAQGVKIKGLEARCNSRLGGLNNTAVPLGGLGSPFSFQNLTPQSYNSGSIGTGVPSQGFLGNAAPGGGMRASVPSYGAYMTAATGIGSGNNGQAYGVVTNNATRHGSGPNVQTLAHFGDHNNGPGRNATSTVSDLSYDTEIQTVDDSGCPYTSDHNL